MKNLESRVNKINDSSLGKRIATYALVGSLVGCTGSNNGCSACIGQSECKNQYKPAVESLWANLNRPEDEKYLPKTKESKAKEYSFR